MEFEKHKAEGDIASIVSRIRAASPPPAINYFRTALVTCSDARVPPEALIPEGLREKILVVENAGNLYVPLPPNIETVILVGHESEEGSGCGACAATASYNKEKTRDKSEDAENPGDHLSEGLRSIVTNCEGDTRENLLRQKELYEKEGKEVVPFIYNHLTGLLSSLQEDNSSFYGEKRSGDGGVVGDVSEIIRLFNSTNGLYTRNFNPSTPNGDMSVGQNPDVMALTLVTRDFAALAGEEYAEPNRVFEVKPGVPENELSLITLGSAEYAWSHALQGEGSSFSGTKTSVILVRNREALSPLSQQLSSNEALSGYLSRQGELFAVVCGNERNRSNDSVEVYKLQ